MPIPDVIALNQRIDNQIRLSDNASTSITLGNGDYTTFIITFTPDSGGMAMGILPFTLYVGSVANANYLPPILNPGASVDASQWQVIPWIDWGLSDNINIKQVVYVRNISAGSSKVIIWTNAKTIVDSARTAGTL